MDALQYDYLTFLTEQIRERVADEATLVYVNKLADVIDAVHGDNGASTRGTSTRRNARRGASMDNKKDAD